MKSRILLGFALFSFCLVAVGFGQKHAVKTYTTEEGMVPFAAENMVQDRLGNLWITTSGGVVMYNGKTFKMFTVDDGLADNATRSIVEDRSGVVWVGCITGGLARIARNERGEFGVTMFTTKDGLSDNAVVSLCLDTEDTLWVGTKNGLTKFKTDSSVQSVHVQRLYSGRFIDLVVQLSNGTYCLATMGELWTWKGSQLQKVRVFSPTEGGISGIVEESVGIVWITSLNEGARRLLFNKNTISILNESNPLPRQIYNMEKDPLGRILFSTFTGGVWIKSSGRWEQLNTASGLPENNIVSTLVNQRGITWIGTANSGLSKLVPYPFTFYDESNGLSGSYVLDIVQDLDGLYWFTSYEKGLTTWDGVSFRKWSSREGLPTERVYSLMVDSKGRIWVSTVGAGVYLYQGKRFERFRRDIGYLSDVLCMMEDREGSIWFGTDAQGAVRVDVDGRMAQFTTENGLAGLRVFSIFQDHRSRIWFGCGQPSRYKEAGGVSIWEPERVLKNINPFVTYGKANSFPTNQVTTVYEDSQGTVWLGLRHKGLMNFNNGQWKIYSRKDGLTSNDVVALQQDRLGRLWIGTVKGLNVWDGKRFQTFTTKDGLLSDEVYENSMTLDRDGKLWFGTPRGVCAFNVDTITLARPPYLYMDRIKCFGQDLPMNALSSLSYDRDAFDFEMTAIDFSNETDIWYQYRMEGYESDWKGETRRDFVSYTNLAPGKYTFMARARSGRSDWTEPVSVPLVIEPAFWQTLWFRGLALLLLLVVTPKLFVSGRAALQRFRRWRSHRVIANYRVKEVIGEGAMGTVYLARDISSKKTVALKVINERLMEDADNKTRFEREGRILSKLNHPNVINVYGVGEFHGRGYIAMELMKHGNLKSFLRINYPLAHGQAASLLIGIAQGLKYIHQQSIVHRDLKSENVMLDEQLRPKIMDFGLSKSVLVSTMTQAGTIMGTLGYAAPEQVTGGRIDQRADIFSFGVIMYEMFTNQLPFHGENEIAMIHSIFNIQPAPPSSISPTVSQAMDKITMRCLEKDPENRFIDGDALLGNLLAASRQP